MFLFPPSQYVNVINMPIILYMSVLLCKIFFKAIYTNNDIFVNYWRKLDPKNPLARVLIISAIPSYIILLLFISYLQIPLEIMLSNHLTLLIVNSSKVYLKIANNPPHFQKTNKQTSKTFAGSFISNFDIF